jgi:hypothetical protein
MPDGESPVAGDVFGRRIFADRAGEEVESILNGEVFLQAF